MALKRLSSWAWHNQGGSTHKAVRSVHLAGGKLSVLTPQSLELCTTSASALSPHSASLSP